MQKRKLSRVVLDLFDSCSRKVIYLGPCKRPDERYYIGLAAGQPAVAGQIRVFFARQEIVGTFLENPAKRYFPLTRIQRLIGERMSKSKRNKPCFYITSKADVTELMALRRELSKSLGVKITSNTFFIRALAVAARQYPVVVGRFNGDSIVLADAINVGFAVDSPQGLVVPVIKNADERSLAEIARLDILLTDKARHNKLTLEDMKGETIALSNLGAYGIDSFIGIAPPPTSTILAAGNVIRTIVPDGGKLAVRKIADLSLAVDHRVIDGAYAAQFLSCIAGKLQDPQQLI